MDLHLIHALRTQLDAIIHDNDSVKAALGCLQEVENAVLMNDSQSAITANWLALISELLHLQKDKVWGIEEDQRSILRGIEAIVQRKGDGSRDPEISLQSSAQSTPWQPVEVDLPPETLERVNEAFYLHGLVMNQSKYIPPGKSLLSIFKRKGEGDPDAENDRGLHERISETVTRAFWDEAFEKLSSPAPAVQLTRLHLLYKDLHTALHPLIPPSYSIMVTLSCALGPTSAPLQSAASHLRELLVVLKERCAPIRDAEVDAIKQQLNDPQSDSLPRICLDVIKGIFHLADEMKHDLADFVVGTWTEKDARQWVRRKGIEVERGVIFNMFPHDVIQKSYREWLSIIPEGTDKPFISRFIKAIQSSVAVSFFPPSDNLLPPPLMCSALDLLYLQNLVQALVILASLWSLLRIPPEQLAGSSWTSRIWTLLELEVERDVWRPVETRLVNLEDEIVQAVGIPGSSEQAYQLRDAVQKVLRRDSPVFILLQSRLMFALDERLKEQLPRQLPARLRTGRALQVETREDGDEIRERELPVKGFEDPVFRAGIKKLVLLTRGSLKWVEDCWPEYVSTE